MSRLAYTTLSLLFASTMSFAQTPTSAPSPAIKAHVDFPARDPHSEGYVSAADLPDATVPGANLDGDFVIGPTHTPAPESTVRPAVPQGKVIEFTMNSADSKYYPGIARDAQGTPDRQTRLSSSFLRAMLRPIRAKSLFMCRSSTWPAPLHPSLLGRTALIGCCSQRSIIS